MAAEAIIRLEGVSKTFRDGVREIRALDGIDLDVAPGTVMALIGRSGSGKSTLLHVIGGLEWPTAGGVSVAGNRLQEMGDAAITRFRLTRIGFVFQSFQLLPSLTVMENLTLPAELAAVPAREATGKARHLLDAVGLGGRGADFPDNLSGGEQQRAAIARGLMLEPPIILADEPTGNLDTHNGQQVLGLILALARDRGATVIVATHSAEVAGLAARVVELRDGRILADTQRDGKGRAARSPATRKTAARPAPAKGRRGPAGGRRGSKGAR